MSKKENNGNEMSLDEIERNAAHFYNDYLKNFDDRMEKFNELGNELKDQLINISPEAGKIADDFLDTVKNFEEKSKKTFEHCRKFVEEGKPAQYKFLKETYDAINEMNEACGAANDYIKKYEKFESNKYEIIGPEYDITKNDDELDRYENQPIDVYTNKFKEIFIKKLKETKNKTIRKVEGRLKNFNAKDKKKAKSDIASLETIFDKICKIGDDGGSLIEMNPDLFDFRSKVDILTKLVENSKKKTKGGR